MITSYWSLSRLPFAQLTALHLPCSHLEPKDALSILRQCPFIISCTLGLSDNRRNTSFPDTTPCLLPELTHLTLRPSHQTFFEYPRCIEALVLPRLTHLYLQGFHLLPLPPSGSVAHCRQAMDHSVWHSPDFGIRHIFIQLTRRKLLRASPLLRELSVPQGIFLSSCLEHIASGALIPRVRNLSCMVDTLDRFHAHLDMLERRKADSSHTVHNAEVTFMNNSGLKEFELSGSARYKKMVTMGWTFNITFELCKSSVTHTEEDS